MTDEGVGVGFNLGFLLIRWAVGGNEESCWAIKRNE